MPYVPRTDAPHLSPDLVEQLARAVGVRLLPEDIEPLAVALSNQLAAIRLLARLDLQGVDPAPSFDPRWPEDRAAAGETGEG